MPARYEQGEKFLRVIQLFQRLSDTEKGLTTRELADELEVTLRSVQRYLATLRDSVGVDLEERDGRIRVGERSRLPAMQLDHAQATILLIALRLLHQLRPTQDPALVGALAQLSRALRVPVVTRYLERTLEAAESRPADPRRTRIERVVIDGFVRRQAVEIEYRAAHGGTSRRTIHPYFLEPRPESRAIYVFAHDGASDQVRTFRLDRVTDSRLLPEIFRVPESFDIDERVVGSWGVWQGGDGDDVHLRFEAAVAARVRETLWHPRAVFRELDDGRIEMRVRVVSEVEMRPWVLSWGAGVEVLGPPSLREHAAATTRAAADRYQQA